MIVDDIEWLRAINPGCRERPDDDCVAAYQEREAVVVELAGRIHQRARLEIPVVMDCPQDAAFFASLDLPTCWIRNEAEGGASMRFSNFEGLFTVLGQRKVRDDDLAWILNVASELGLRFVPESLFGERSERFNDDLFNQLFDYV